VSQTATRVLGPALAATCFCAAYALGGSQWNLVAAIVFNIGASTTTDTVRKQVLKMGNKKGDHVV
jgi:hypothetical protein